MKIERIETSKQHHLIVLWGVWHAFVCVFLLVCAMYGLRRSFSPAPAADQIQLLLLVVGYLALGLYIVPAAQRSRQAVLAHLVVASALGFGGAYLALKVLHLPVSAGIMGIGGIGATCAALVPYLPLKGRVWAIAGLVIAGVGLAAVHWSKVSASGTVRETIETALYNVEADAYSGLIPPPESDGGALESGRSGLILVTGDGKFYWIREVKDGLKAAAVDIPDPMNRAAYLKDFDDPDRRPRLRTTDVIFDRSPEPKMLYVSHQQWHHDQRCHTMAVSAIPLTWSADGKPRAAGQWRLLFDSAPCLKAGGLYDDSETGGRLAWGPDGRLIFTLGNFGFAGLAGEPALSQRTDADYGKILSIDPQTGQHEVFTTGHRNPQGLIVDSAGMIWESEHGPQGGDEINVIEKGANYGWPYVTYGTNYGSKTWDLNPDAHDHGKYHEPAVAFLPSMAISPIMEVNGPEFPHWNGDLLAGSLRTEAILRVRHRGDRVIYVESFSVKHRVRDLVQAPSGRILIWSDDGTLIDLSQSRVAQGAFARFCAGCHEPKFGVAPGPPLAGVAGRRIASVPDFAYSSGLRKKGGTWSEQNLDAFLRDPQAFAPGTTMQLHGLDDKSRREVIAELQKKR